MWPAVGTSTPLPLKVNICERLSRLIGVRFAFKKNHMNGLSSTNKKRSYDCETG